MNISGYKVSVIVSVYNGEQYLSKCIESILHQTYRDFELILVNDGSEDGSEAVCRSYDDARVRVFSQPNRGVSAARNRGLDEARGEWVYFCDADDELYEDALERFVQKTESPEVCFVMGGYEIYDIDGNMVYSRPEREELTLTIDQCIENMFQPWFYCYQGYLWTKLFRRDRINAAGLRFDERISFNEDRLFSTQYLCSVSGRGCYFTHPVYRYYERPGSAMSSLKRGFNYKFLTDLDAFAIMLATITDSGKSEALVRQCKVSFLWSIDNIRHMYRKYRLKDRTVINKMRYAEFHFIGLRTLVALRMRRFSKIGVLMSELSWRLRHRRMDDRWFYDIGTK